MPLARLIRCKLWSVLGPNVLHFLRPRILTQYRLPRPSTRPLFCSAPILRPSVRLPLGSPTHLSTSKTRIYDKLGRKALDGEYEAVQSITEKLVKEYGESPNSRLYETLMLANAESWNGSADEVAGLLRNMADDVIDPNSAILHGALQALAIHPDYLLRSYIIRELRQRWLSLTQSGWHYLVLGLIRDRQLEKALEAFEQMGKAGVIPQPWLLDTMLYTLCSLEEFDEALRLLEDRLNSGDTSISPTLWANMLDSASRALHYPLTRFVCDVQVRNSYLNPSSGVCANILSTAARHGDIHLGTLVLQLLSRRSGSPVQLHHYEALIEAYIARKALRKAVSLLAIMKAAGKPPTEGSTRPIFTYLSQCRQYPYRAHKILHSIRGEGRTIPIQAVNVLIEAYVHHQHLSPALELYKSMEILSPTLIPNIATFNNLLRGCAFHKRKDIAMFRAREMVALDIEPNALTYDRLLLVCINTDQGLGNAWCYFDEMKAAGWGPRGGTAVTLAKKACAMGHRRVWDLVEDENGPGLPSDKVKSLVSDFWRSGKEAVKMELNPLVT